VAQLLTVWDARLILVVGLACLVASQAAWTAARELRREMISLAGVGAILVMSLLMSWPLLVAVLFGGDIPGGSALAGAMLGMSVLVVLWGLVRAASPLMARVYVGLLLWLAAPFITELFPWDMVGWLLFAMGVWGVVALGVVSVSAWELRGESGLWRWLGLSLLCAFLCVQVFSLQETLSKDYMPQRAAVLYGLGVSALSPGLCCWPMILIHRRRWPAALALASFGGGIHGLFIAFIFSQQLGHP
jgi:hypothetical protein